MKNSTQPSNQQGHSSKAGSGRANGNRFVVSDFGKLVRWRRGLGPWDDAMLLAVLDIVIPRHAQLKTTSGLGEALLRWVTTHLPEIVERYGAEWVETRRVEIMSREYDSFPTMDEIAVKLHITRDEVEGACLQSLRAFDNPKRARKQRNLSRNAERKREWRAENKATPHSKSKARTKPWEALGMTRATYYRNRLHEAPSGDEKPVTRETDSSDTETVRQIRQIQFFIKTTDDHDLGRDVSGDWRSLIRASHLAETVELPF